MDNMPRLSLAHLPTPVELMPRLGAQLGGHRLLIKRDDQTGLAFGGNKTRKLEYLLADAQQQEARTLVTGGSVQSNHCRQTAAAAARFGLDCILVLSGDRPGRASGNLLLDQLFGAEIVFTTRPERDAIMRQTFQEAGRAGRAPYLIPYGGSNPIGAVAYAQAIRELIAQQVTPDWIVLASSSGGTQAGLVAGATICNFGGNILGISVDEPRDWLQERVADLARRTLERMGHPGEIDPQSIAINVDYLGAGYGKLDAPEKEAIRLFARCEGILLDPVYTGRAAAGLIDLLRKGFFTPQDQILFWHTGGTPALLADRYQDVAS